MHKSFLILLWSLINITQFAFSQKEFFSWSAGAENLNSAFMDIEVMPDNSLIAIFKIDGSNYPGKFLQGDGKSVSLNLGQSGTMVMAFSPEGQVLWQKAIPDAYGGVYQVEKNEKGEIVLLAQVHAASEYSYDDDAEDDKGTIPGLGLYRADVGCHIIHLSQSGRLIKNIHVPELGELEIDECYFRTYVSGKYLLAGTGGGDVLSEKLDLFQRNDNDEYVLAIDTNGKIEWGDIIFYRKGGGYIVGGRHLTFAPDGTVYYSGVYPYGATFSNGLQTLVPVNYEEINKNHDHYEGFIISYSPNGKINWIKTDGTSTFMGAIAATDEGVFVSHRTAKNKLFGQKVDTTGYKNTGITFLDRKGEIKWNLMASIDKIESMSIDEESNALMLGTCRIRSGFYQNTGEIGSFTLPERDESFIVNISPNGKVHWVKSSDLWISTQNDPFVMTSNGKGDIYIAGLMWVSMSFEIKKKDASLPDLKAAGGISIVGKVR